MDVSVIAVGVTVVSNVLALGFIYGKMVAQFNAMRDELRAYVKRTDRTIERHDRELGDLAQRVVRLEAQRPQGVVA